MKEKDEIANICRKYAYVPYREDPYNTNLSMIKKNLEESFQAYCDKSSEEELQKTRETLETLPHWDLGERIKSLLSNLRKNGNLEKVREYGDQLVVKKRDIKRFQELIRERYNQESEFFYTLETNLRRLQEFKRNYQTKLEKIGKEIKDLYESSKDEKKLRKDLENMVREKEKEEKRTLSPEEREKIKKTLVDLGIRRLNELSTSYLMLKNDLMIIESLETIYSPLTKNKKEVIVLLDELVKFSYEQAAAIEAVLSIYQTVTREQISYLINGNLPPSLIEKVNKLVRWIEEVDKKVGEEVLKKLFEEQKNVKKVNISPLISNLVEEVRKKENGSNI